MPIRGQRIRLATAVLLVMVMAYPHPATAHSEARVAAWNLAANAYFHGHSQATIQRGLDEMLPRVASAINRMDPDVIGLVEVESEAALHQLADELDERYGLSYQRVFAPTGRHLNIGVLAKDRVELGESKLVAATTLGTGRLRESLGVPVSVGAFDFQLIVVHLKSGSGGSTRVGNGSLSARKVRVRQCAELAQYILEQRERLGERDCLVVGDYNMFPRRDRPAFEALAASGTLRFISNEELCEGPDMNSCAQTHKAGNMLDGFAIAADDTEEYITGSLQVLHPIDLFSSAGPYAYCREQDAFWNGVSDHLPLLARFLRVDMDRD